MRHLHVFQAGTHQPMVGGSITITPADVVALAAAYDPARHEAPLVVGHPKEDEPAYGWVERATARDGGLYVDATDVDPEFAEIVRAGRYRKVSASFYRPESAGNPTPGVWALRHVGFLGAVPPAVKGLRPVTLADGDADSVTFAAGGMAPMRLSERERAMALYENRRLVDRGLDAGKLMPRDREFLVGFLDSLADSELVSFAEHDGKRVVVGQREGFRRFLEGLPTVVDFRELSRDADDEAGASGFAAPSGHAVPTDRLELHRRAVAYQQRHKVDYATAVRAAAGR